MEVKPTTPTLTMAEAKKMCTDAGFKIEREDKMSIKEAEELLKDQGYNIQPSQFTHDAVQKLILDEKTKWEEAHDIQLEKVSEDQKIVAAQSIINNAVNQIVGMFEPAVQQVMGALIDKKEEQTKKVKTIAKKLRQKPKPQAPPEPIEITAEDIADEDPIGGAIHETFEAVDLNGEEPGAPSEKGKKKK
ncbi:hypothetical protein ES703_64855 [subsurface metagenome]